MNRYDFTQPGGFPFDQGVMEFIQDCINTAASTATLAGSLAILSGCTVAGGSVSNGVVVINGEILPFVGGVISAKVIVQETATAIAYQDGTPRTVKYQRSARFGDDGVTNNLWVNFKRNTAEGILARLDRLEWLTAPDKIDGGSMRLWRKPITVPLPVGWREVVDWRGRLAMGHKPGTDGFEIGDIAGAEGHAMTLDNLIEHDHEQYVSATDTTDEQIEENHIDGGSGRGLWRKLFGRTKKTGQAEPTPIPTIPPVKMVMFIEPDPNYIP